MIIENNVRIRSNIFKQYQKLKRIDPKHELLKYLDVKYQRKEIGKIKEIAFKVEYMKEFFEKYYSKTLYQSYNKYLNSLEDQIEKYRYGKKKD